MQNTSIRIWDLPTRLFHWALAVCVVSLVVTAKMNAMDWHFRLGYCVLALLVFRIVWGLVGGYWSRFKSFLFTPGQFARHLSGKEEHSAGHSPLGALSVFALLLALVVQVATGLTSDDEISVSGPLTRFVSGDLVSTATWWHAKIGQYLLYVLVGLHVLAIVVYALRGKKLVGSMVTGDKQLPATTRPSRDSAATRITALILLGATGGLAWWVSTLGSF